MNTHNNYHLEGWKKQAISQIARIISGTTPKSDNPLYWDGDIVWITPDDLSSKSKFINTSLRKITQFGFRNTGLRFIKPNSIVVSSRAPVGYISIINVPFTTNQGCKSLELKKDSVEFIYYLLHSNVREMHRLSNGTTFQEISKTQLGKIELKLPDSIKEQVYIASILTKVDLVIEKSKQLISKYKNIKQGLMQDLFRYGIDEKGQIRSEKTHKFKNSPLGCIPEEWEIYRLSDLLTQIIDFRGKTPKKIGMEWGEGNIPALSANNVEMGQINFEKETYFGSEKLYRKWMNKGDCCKGDIVMTMEAPLGNIAQITDDRKYILSQRVVLLKPNSLATNNYFMYCLMSEYFHHALYLDSTGTTATGIQQKKLMKIQLPIPKDKNEQEKIAEAITIIQSTINKEEKFKNKLMSIKQGLMQDLLTGKVRVVHLLN